MHFGLLLESIFRDSKHGAALRHLPSGYPQVNTAWMWGALLAASMAAWLHQLTTATRRPGHPGRPRRPRRQGHDRNPPPPADQRPRPAGTPRAPADPAAAARPRPARRGPRQAAGPPRNVLTTGPQGPDRNPRKPRTRRDPGYWYPRTRAITPNEDQHPHRNQLRALFAESGQTRRTRHQRTAHSRLCVICAAPGPCALSLSVPV